MPQGVGYPAPQMQGNVDERIIHALLGQPISNTMINDAQRSAQGMGGSEELMRQLEQLRQSEMMMGGFDRDPRMQQQQPPTAEVAQPQKPGFIDQIRAIFGVSTPNPFVHPQFDDPLRGGEPSEPYRILRQSR